MKTIQCFYEKCGNRRLHHEIDRPRGIRTAQVPDNYDDPWWCSLTCMFMDPKSGHSVRGYNPDEDQYKKENK